MDKQSIKALIIELNDKGYTFKEISDTLSDNYNINMTRQAVHGMYKRALNSVEHTNKVKELTHNILTLYSLGFKVTQLKEKYPELTVRDIESVLENNKDKLEKIRNNQVTLTANMIKNGQGLDEIEKALSFENERPTENVLKNIVKQASYTLINSNASVVLAKLFMLIEDRDILKDAIAKFNLDITFRDIGKAINNCTSSTEKVKN